MAKNCKNCALLDYDGICLDGHIFMAKLPIRCPYYQCKQNKFHKERFTECDMCNHLSECKEDLLDITSFSDMHRHYIKGLGSNCLKEGNII